MYSLKMANGPFDSLLSCDEAAKIWGIDPSAIRKAIQAGRLEIGWDCCKFGKQWVVTARGMANVFEGGITPWEKYLDQLCEGDDATRRFYALDISLEKLAGTIPQSEVQEKAQG